MPLLTPNQIHAVIKETRPSSSSDKNDGGIRELLDKNNLSKDEVLETIASIMRGGDSDAIRFQAAKVGAQLNGMLTNSDIAHAPVVNIIINDSNVGLINPILIPR